MKSAYYKPTRKYWSEVHKLRNTLEERGKPLRQSALKFMLGMGFPFTQGRMLTWETDEAEYAFTTAQAILSVGHVSCTAVDTITQEPSPDQERWVGQIDRSYITLALLGNNVEVYNIGLPEMTSQALIDMRINLGANMRAQRKLGISTPDYNDYENLRQTLILGAQLTRP